MASGGSFNNATIDAYDNNLISIWDWEDNANDNLSYADGTEIGSPTYVTGINNKAIDLNGSTQYVQLPSNKWKTQESGTISLWCKPDSFGADNMSMFAHASDGFSNFYFFNIMWNPWGGGASRLLLQMKINGTLKNLFFGTSLESNTSIWHNVIMTSDGTNNKCYLDGSEVSISSGTDEGNWFADASYTDTQNSYIGLSEQDLATTAEYAGLIDQYCIWDTAISSSAASAIWNSGTGRFWATDESSSSSPATSSSSVSSSDSSSSFPVSSSSSPSSQSSMSSSQSSSSTESSSTDSSSSISSSSSSESVLNSSSSSSEQEAWIDVTYEQNMIIAKGQGTFTVQNRTESTNLDGSRTPSWADYVEMPGWLQPVSSSLREQYMRREIMVDAVIYVAQEDPDVQEGDRIVAPSGKKYLIHGVEDQAGQNRLWHLDCEEVR